MHGALGETTASCESWAPLCPPSSVDAPQLWPAAPCYPCSERLTATLHTSSAPAAASKLVSLGAKRQEAGEREAGISLRWLQARWWLVLLAGTEGGLDLGVPGVGGTLTMRLSPQQPSRSQWRGSLWPRLSSVALSLLEAASPWQPSLSLAPLTADGLPGALSADPAAFLSSSLQCAWVPERAAR